MRGLLRSLSSSQRASRRTARGAQLRGAELRPCRACTNSPARDGEERPAERGAKLLVGKRKKGLSAMAEGVKIWAPWGSVRPAARAPACSQGARPGLLADHGEACWRPWSKEQGRSRPRESRGVGMERSCCGCCFGEGCRAQGLEVAVALAVGGGSTRAMGGSGRWPWCSLRAGGQQGRKEARPWLLEVLG